MTSLRNRIVLPLALAASAFAAAPAAATGVPVIDPSAIAQIRNTVSVATKQLAAAQQMLQQEQQMRNTIGQIGPGSLGKIMQQSGLDFSSPTGSLKDLSSISSQVSSFSNSAGNLPKVASEQLSIQPITDLASGRNAAANMFFTGADINQQTVSELRTRREAVVRESALSGYGAASSMKADLVKTQQTADGLSKQAAAAPDLRGDVQANTATMLAVYGELAKQTALQAQMLEVESATTLAGDPVGRRSN